jgi:PAS domain S-box-containing protein
MEVSLKESEIYFKDIFEHVSVGVAFISLDGKVLAINRTLEGILELPKEDIVGKHIIRLAKKLLSLKDISLVVPVLTSLLQKKKVKPFQIEYKNKVLEISTRCNIKSNRITATVLDISERKLANEALLESEERFRSLFENSTIGIYRTTPAGRILLANPALVRILGFSTFEDLSKRNLEKEGFEPSYERSKFMEIMKRDNEVVGLESSWKRHDGVQIFVRESARPYYDADNRILYYDGTVEDITERKMAEQALEKRTKELQNELEERKLTEIELQKLLKEVEVSKLATLNLLRDIKLEMQQRKKAENEIHNLNAELEHRVIERTILLEAANKELEAFAYSVSHDLRAPLRAIDGFSRFMMEDYYIKLDPEGKRLLGLIRSNTLKMDKLITDILALSRVSRGETRVSKVNMTKMAMSMFNEVISSEMKGKINFVIDKLPEAIADSTYIKQVWINLISNAIKFSSFKKKPEIKIGGYTEKEFHVYYVNDNGVGFNQEYAHKLFGVFQRLHKADEFEGSGVGLAIVQRIIHRHGGEVWAEGKENKGATFYFSLPLKS